MKKPERFVIASNNLEKTAELVKSFKWFGEQAISYQEILPKQIFPAEGSKSYIENAKIKSAFIAKMLPQEFIVADDSGMILDAYPDWLGVLTARNLDMKHLNDQELNNKILKLLLNKKRGVQMISNLVGGYYRSETVVATGRFIGEVSQQARGENGRGFDLILQQKDTGKTLAELSDDQKIPLLHRTKAVHNLLLQLQ